MSNTSPTHQECNDYDIDDVVGIINTNNNEDTPAEMIGDYAGLASELDYNSFLQQQWLDLYSGLTRWNTEEVDGSGCPPLPTKQPQLKADANTTYNYGNKYPQDSNNLSQRSTVQPPMTTTTQWNDTRIGKPLALLWNANTLVPALPKFCSTNQLLMMLPPNITKQGGNDAITTREKINIHAFTLDKEVTTGEAIVYYIKTGKPIDVNDDTKIQEAVMMLMQLKKSIKEMAHSHLVGDLLMSSKTLTFADGSVIPNRRVDDLCEVWSKHPELAPQFWTILIWRYEEMGEWEVKFEKALMEKMKLEYVHDDNSTQSLTAETKDSEGNIVKVTHQKRSSIQGNKSCVANTDTGKKGYC
jgi:hypothetical protein